MSEAVQRRALCPEVKVISEKTGEVDYIASDETLDCYHEIVRARGWRFDRFAKNAPFVDSHNYHELEYLLGKVVDFKVRNGQLVERVKWMIDVPEQKLATLGFKMTVAGYLKAVSVGFTPLKMLWQGSEDFAKAVKEMGLASDVVAKLRCIHWEQDQIELSACVIGANPNALVKSFKDGVISEGELAACGFVSDAEMRFLHDAGDAYAAAAPVVRSMIGTELQRIFRARSLSLGGGSSAASPGQPGGGDSAQGRAAEEAREKFLSELQAAVKAAQVI